MTEKNIEQEFFEVFGIEPEIIPNCDDCSLSDECFKYIATQALQNQQKTFTLKEIKEIVKNNLTNRCEYSTCKRLGDICSECPLAKHNLLISKFEVLNAPDS